MDQEVIAVDVISTRSDAGNAYIALDVPMPRELVVTLADDFPDDRVPELIAWIKAFA